MRIYYCLFYLLFSINISIKAQLLDSIKESFTNKPKFLLKLDARNSFISASNVEFKGFKIGLNYKNTTKIGIGASWMSTNFSSIYKNDTVRLENINILTFIEYNFYKSKHWYADIPIQLGFGELSYTDKKIKKAKTFIFTYEPAMTIEYRFLRIFGIGFGFGYRFAFYSSRDISESLTTPIYILRFKVHFSKIFKNK